MYVCMYVCINASNNNDDDDDEDGDDILRSWSVPHGHESQRNALPHTCPCPCTSHILTDKRTQERERERNEHDVRVVVRLLAWPPLDQGPPIHSFFKERARHVGFVQASSSCCLHSLELLLLASWDHIVVLMLRRLTHMLDLASIL